MPSMQNSGVKMGQKYCYLIMSLIMRNLGRSKARLNFDFCNIVAKIAKVAKHLNIEVPLMFGK